MKFTISENPRTDADRAAAKLVLKEHLEFLGSEAVINRFTATKGINTGKIGVADQKYLEKHHNFITIHAPRVNSILEEFNLIKIRLDTAYELSNWDDISKLVVEINSLINREEITKLRANIRFKRNLKHFTPIIKFAEQQLKGIYNIRDYMVKGIKTNKRLSAKRDK